MRGGRTRGVLGTLFRYEIRMLFRDTRTLLIAVVAPIVLMPGYILILNFVDSREERALEEEVYRYAVTGSREAWARGLVEEAIALEEADPDTTRTPVRFQAREVPDPFAELEAGELHVVVEGLTPQEWDSIRSAEAEADPN